MYVHWGDEYELVHNAKQRDLAEKLIAAGVDLIIGHHPHVVQDIEVIDGVPVLYSLGNFIFDQYFSTEVQIGYTVDLVLSSTSQKVNLVPHTAQAKTQPRLMTETEKIGFHEALAHRSDPTLTNAIKAGLITF